MHVIQFGKVLYDLGETIVEVLLSVLHFSGVKCTNSRDFVSLVHDCWRLSLCLRQHNVDKVLKNNNKVNNIIFVLRICKQIHEVMSRAFGAPTDINKVTGFLQLTFAGGTTIIFLKLYKLIFAALYLFSTQLKGK